jgi:ribosome-associated toxin RatA of RatAB toxin-antitoxin module
MWTIIEGNRKKKNPLNMRARMKVLFMCLKKAFELQPMLTKVKNFFLQEKYLEQFFRSRQP